MSHKVAVSGAVLLTASLQFLMLIHLLWRPEFGGRDFIFSTANATAFSFAVSVVFCLPALLMLKSNARLKVYGSSYVLGFFVTAVMMNILTAKFLGWPLDKNNVLSLEETLIGAALLTVLITPLALLSTVIFGGILRLIQVVSNQKF